MFPNGSKTFSVDEHSSTLTGIIAPSSTIDRTAIYCHISQSGNVDSHISLSTTSTGRTICDTETNGVVDSFAPIVIPAGVDVVWDKGNSATRFQGQITLVDYNVSSSSVPTSTDYSVELHITNSILLISLVISIIMGIRAIFGLSRERI